MKLKELRERAGLSQAELGNKAGVTQGFISHIELGVREPTLKIARKISAALGVTVADLLDEPQAKASGE